METQQTTKGLNLNGYCVYVAPQQTPKSGCLNGDTISPPVPFDLSWLKDADNEESFLEKISFVKKEENDYEVVRQKSEKEIHFICNSLENALDKTLELISKYG